MNVTQDITNDRRRIPQIDILRFLMVLVVVFYHRYGAIMSQGYLAVEFFFILTGYLTMKSISKISADTLTIEHITHFLKRKIAVFYPELIVTSMGGCLFSLYLAYSGEINFTGCIYGCLENFLQNLVLLRMTGIAGTAAICVPTWYLSSMIIALIILLPLIFRCKNPFLRMVFSLFLYSTVLYKLGGLEKQSYADWVHFTYGGNIRAIAGILLGSVAYNVVEVIRTYKLSQTIKTLITFGIVLMLSLFFVILFSDNGKLDGMAVCTHFVLIITSFSNLFIFHSFFYQKIIYSICCNLGKFSLPLYLGHVFPLYIQRDLLQHYELNTITYLILAIVSGLIIMLAAHYIRYHIKVINKS